MEHIRDHDAGPSARSEIDLGGARDPKLKASTPCDIGRERHGRRPCSSSSSARSPMCGSASSGPAAAPGRTGCRTPATRRTSARAGAAAENFMNYGEAGSEVAIEPDGSASVPVLPEDQGAAGQPHRGAPHRHPRQPEGPPAFEAIDQWRPRSDGRGGRLVARDATANASRQRDPKGREPRPMSASAATPISSST